MLFRMQYAFLSNFFEEEDGKTLEHRYQAEKACFDGDKFAIMDMPSPGAAKRMGRDVIAVPGWEQRKIEVMKKLVRAKFLNPKLACRLAHVDGEIIEHNQWHDNFWGSCICESCGDKGQNHLGRILMQVRDEVRQRRLF